MAYLISSELHRPKSKGPSPKSPPKINKALSIHGRYQYPSVSIKPGWIQSIDFQAANSGRREEEEEDEELEEVWGAVSWIPPGISWIPWDFRDRLKHDSLNTAMIASILSCHDNITFSMMRNPVLW